MKNYTERPTYINNGFYTGTVKLQNSTAWFPHCKHKTSSRRSTVQVRPSPGTILGVPPEIGPVAARLLRKQ